MSVNITVPNRLLRGFKKRALASDVEVFGFLIGNLIKENNILTRIVIQAIHYPKVLATKGEVNVLEKDRDVRRAVAPMLLLGSIHSHPDIEYDGISTEDAKDGARRGEAVFAVYHIWPKEEGKKRFTRLDWYVGAPLGRVKVR
jgi:hypothetical protein